MEKNVRHIYAVLGEKRFSKISFDSRRGNGQEKLLYGRVWGEWNKISENSFSFWY